MRSVRELHFRRECLLDEISLEQSRIANGASNPFNVYELYAALEETEAAISSSDQEYSYP
jgi:hypothetical protein